MRTAVIIPLFVMIGCAIAAEPLSSPRAFTAARANRVTFEVPTPAAATPDLSEAFPTKPDLVTHSASLGDAARGQPTTFTVKFASSQITPETIEHHSKTATELLRSIMNGDPKAFVFWGTERFKGFKTEKFQDLVSFWSSPLTGGWSLSYLGELKKGAGTTTVWRVQFFDRSPEGLLTVATDKKGSVESFGLY